MPQLDRGLVKQRAKALRAKGRDVLWKFLEKQTGETHRVLIESGELGRTEQFTPVILDEGKAGEFATVVIDGHDGTRLNGHLLASTKAA